ncbi:serine aminopeptidase domain-containing protein [Oceanicoccus sp. KOV_DT_Chl]|uniref:serine aminopeptidase domain-containing protein n=1 Tax=Oceanicoccus sp. KOV_DT_Chl TaxID=1904639 RepID=UPI000C79BB64|nr:alpha/beta hydrolase [Oceanicoccus sp. KOV_DT_Chl]
MNPFFFGDSKEPLYGVYHPPAGANKDEGVVLCYPFGQEGMRAHRAMRQLAMQLTKKGFHVLRFDCRGTGDSALDMEDIEAQTWLEDTGVAIDELRAMAGVSQISVIGLRLGALIAAATATARSDIKRLVLWDPILSGADYIRELKQEISQEKPIIGNYEEADGRLNFNGFALTACFQQGLEKLQLLEMKPNAKQIYQAVSHKEDAFAALKQSWSAYEGFHYRMTPAPHDWNYVDKVGGILLPQPIIQAIVNWME